MADEVERERYECREHLLRLLGQLERWRKDPKAFALDVLGIEVEPWVDGVHFVDIKPRPGPGARRFWDERATALRKAAL